MKKRFKLSKWISKRDVISILILMIFYAAVIEFVIKDELLRTILTVIYYPIMLLILQSAFESKKGNNDSNVDVTILKQVDKGTKIWKCRDKNNSNVKNKCILELTNSGEICIYALNICVIENTGESYKYVLNEMFSPKKVFYIEIPTKIKYVEKVEVTFSLVTEGRTKVFDGCKTESKGRTIFSNVSRYDEDKYSIYHKYEKNEFIKLEKFFT